MSKISHPWEQHWEEIEPLGKGGQGITRKVQNRDNPQQLGALKILKNNKSAQARSRMRTEVVSLQELSTLGAAVPKVLEDNTQAADQGNCELYVVMEYIPGRTISSLVSNDGPLDIEIASSIATQLCDIISIGHEKNILHRDLKPDNVIARDNDPKDIVIVDYGLSFNLEQPGLTQTNEAFQNSFLDLPETNTPGGNRRDPRSDLTAICGIFYFTLTGNYPGQLRDQADLPPHRRQGRSVHGRIKDDPRVPQLGALFECGFRVSVEHRFQTAEELKNRIVAIVRPAATAPDPLSVAKRLRERLEQHDEVTIRRLFEKPANAVMKRIEERLIKYIEILKDEAFDVLIGSNLAIGGFGGSPTPRVAAPPERFEINVPPVHVVVGIRGHRNGLLARYSIFCQRKECVVVRTVFKRDKSVFTEAGTQQDVVWLPECQYSDSDLDTIENDLKAWLCSAMELCYKQTRSENR